MTISYGLTIQSLLLPVWKRWHGLGLSHHDFLPPPPSPHLLFSLALSHVTPLLLIMAVWECILGISKEPHSLYLSFFPHCILKTVKIQPRLKNKQASPGPFSGFTGLEQWLQEKKTTTTWKFAESRSCVSQGLMGKQASACLLLAVKFAHLDGEEWCFSPQFLT